MATFDDLTRLVTRLRAPDGCPWDRAQTVESMRAHVLEEAHEVVDAIDRGDPEGLREELGDLFFNLSLVARVAQERGAFTLEQVFAGILDKMVRRHPHVFGDAANGGDARSWDAQKAAEKHERRSLLDGLPASLPALLRARRLASRAARVGFDWPDADGARRKVDEELAELDEAVAGGDPERARAELGDCLMALANLARKLEVDPEDALREANLRFERRFRWMESEAAREGVALEGRDAEALEALWRRAKQATDQDAGPKGA